MIHYRWTSAIVGVAIAFVILYLIRRDHLQPRYALWWLVTSSVVVILGFWPQLIDIIGHKLGIHYPPVLLIIVGIGFILIKMLKMDIDRSQRERRLRRLTQRLAILEGDRWQDAKDNLDEAEPFINSTSTADDK